MSYYHCIITRFSYRFKKDDPIDGLLASDRLDHRVNIFSKYCHKNICSQNSPNFYWIIIVDPLLPIKYHEELNDLINNHYESKDYEKKGPRRIWLHTWNWDSNKLENIDWILGYLQTLNDYHCPKYLITTRLDDDDCLNIKFIKKCQEDLLASVNSNNESQRSFKYISYSTGYQHYVSKGILKASHSPMIALGLSLICNVENYPICVYLGNHTRIPYYLQDPSKHKKLFELYQKNNDWPVKIKQFKDRLSVNRNEIMYMRTVHGFNLQNNLKKYSSKEYKGKHSPLVIKKVKILFNIDL